MAEIYDLTPERILERMQAFRADYGKWPTLPELAGYGRWLLAELAGRVHAMERDGRVACGPGRLYQPRAVATPEPEPAPRPAPARAVPLNGNMLLAKIEDFHAREVRYPTPEELAAAHGWLVDRVQDHLHNLRRKKRARRLLDGTWMPWPPCRKTEEVTKPVNDVPATVPVETQVANLSAEEAPILPEQTPPQPTGPLLRRRRCRRMEWPPDEEFAAIVEEVYAGPAVNADAALCERFTCALSPLHRHMMEAYARLGRLRPRRRKMKQTPSIQDAPAARVEALAGTEGAGEGVGLPEAAGEARAGSEAHEPTQAEREEVSIEPLSEEANEADSAGTTEAAQEPPAPKPLLAEAPPRPWISSTVVPLPVVLRICLDEISDDATLRRVLRRVAGEVA